MVDCTGRGSRLAGHTLCREPLSVGCVSVGDGSDGRGASDRAPVPALPAGRGTDMIRNMVEVRIESIEPELLESAGRRALGLRPPRPGADHGLLPGGGGGAPLALTWPCWTSSPRACRAPAWRASPPPGCAPASRAGAEAHLSADDLRALVEALDASPMPGGEWRPARELLGDELLARLVGGVSQSSLRRYASGARETPDDIAWRLHVVARILAALLGSYNAYGVRRWFERRRTPSAGSRPSRCSRRPGTRTTSCCSPRSAWPTTSSGAGSAT